MEVRVESLFCGYGKEEPVLSDINLEMSTDDGLICIIGPNGVGKSTLIKCIDGLIQPQSGAVLLDGKDVREYGRKELADRIGYVQSVYDTRSNMSVFETVSMGRFNHMGWRVSAEDLQMVDRAIRVMGIQHLSEKSINELSAGQFQKAMIARGLVQDTEVLILDEPTSNLDIRSQVFVTSLLKNMANVEKKLIIMISHDVNIASKMADKILILARPGRVLAFGTPEEVITESNIMEAYGVECDITDHEGRPNILIRSDSV
jgi:iron complex transport system ATP-binding protein